MKAVYWVFDALGDVYLTEVSHEPMRLRLVTTVHETEEGEETMNALPFRSEIEPVELEAICECGCPESDHEPHDYDFDGERLVPCKRPCATHDSCRSFSEDR